MINSQSRGRLAIQLNRRCGSVLTANSAHFYLDSFVPWPASSRSTQVEDGGGLGRSLRRIAPLLGLYHQDGHKSLPYRFWRLVLRDSLEGFY